MIKKLNLLILLLSAIVIPQQTLALSQTQTDVLNLGIRYFNTETGSPGDSCSGSGGVIDTNIGSGPLYGPFFPDVAVPSDLVQVIQKYISTTVPSSPLVSFSSVFVSLGQKYNVNPTLVVAMAQQETSLGTAGNGTPSGGYNITNLRPNGFAVYSSYNQGIDESYKNLAGSLYLGPPSNFTTVAEIINRWAPPTDKNNTSAYIQFVSSAMHQMLDGVTESSDSSTDQPPNAFEPGSSDVQSCVSSGTYEAGANGYNLTGANSMVSFHQCDSPWGAESYGSGGTICATGCGITSLAMVIDTLKGLNKTPGDYAQQYGQYNQGGTTWSLWPKAASDYSLTEQDIGADFTKAAATLRQGGLVIIPVDSSGGGYFTHDSHLMVLRAVDDKGNFYLADPGTNDQGINSYAHNTEATPYSVSFLQNNGFMGSLFAFTPKG